MICDNFKLAVCGLAATALLTACGGGSSSSSGAAAGTRTYQQGFAAGTAATLEIVLDDLRALQMTLAGDGAPAETSRGTLGRSFALLAPRQRETLAASLLTFIARVEAARAAAAAPTAGTTEAEAAQAAADEALRALQLVIEADTAARVGGSEVAQTAVINALNQIAAVDADAPDASTQIDAALTAALTAAENEVARLERELAEAQAAVAQAGQAAGGTAAQTIERLNDQLDAARRNLNDAANRARGVKPGFGPVTTSTPSSTDRPAQVAFHRRTAKEFAPVDYLNFDTDGTDETGTDAEKARNIFEPHGTAAQQADYAFTGGAQGVGNDPDGGGAKTAWAATDNAYDPPSASIDLTPAAVLYAAGQKRVIAADPNTGHFRARGSVFRGIKGIPINDRVVNASDTAVQNTEAASPTVDSNVRNHRLIFQGRRQYLDNPSTTGTDESDPAWDNAAHVPLTTFRYDPTRGLTMGFGGDGVIWADLERYAAKGCWTAGQRNCNNPVTADIEISFGAPDFDPAHQGMFYWSADVASPRLKADGTAADTPPGQDHGQYRLLLANDAGASRQLSYAAYGLFDFYDNLYNPGTPIRHARVQTFHYGVEAFEDESGRRVSDMDRISATFRGRTHGWLVASKHARSRNQGFVAGYNEYEIGSLTRMRGDLTLRANIGGAQADTISGVIGNLRQSPTSDLGDSVGSNVPWVAGGLPQTIELKGAYANGVIGNAPMAATTDSDSAAGALGIARGALATAAAVAADGSFQGTVVPMGTRADNWERGEYEGALYGPTGALEAAGTWWLQAEREDYLDYEAIIGSFGAVCTTGCN